MQMERLETPTAEGVKKWREEESLLEQKGLNN